ncbi:hypothetical protein [Streptomyces sp. MB09-02B]|uniref:hypothetical protein n=1 Tax=Streptomyces sp. MB09-02B TaxID=3028667 RepID=UPI0029B41087|nr:hypothetical protein [Streptomyces sp. MB09-02B]MDX3641161.1 hypothetical protein [Streptomyces sp. MB09-02B]
MNTKLKPQTETVPDTTVLPQLPLLTRPSERTAPAQEPAWVALLLAGDPDDDGSEPHICRGID